VMINESSNNEKLTYRTEDLEKAQKRIAELEQEKAELTRKGGELCCAYGNELIKTHELEQKLTDLWTAATILQEAWKKSFANTSAEPLLYGRLGAAIERSRVVS